MRHSLALILLLTLTACSVFSKDKKIDEDIPSVEQLYADAREQMDSRAYEKAVMAFERLQSSYPYGRYAQQAQIEIAYAYYKQKEMDSAISAADRFIKQYPNSPHVDYAYYLKGLIYFNEDLGIFGDLLQQDLSERDPNAARESFYAFKDLVTRFPDSKYAPDSRLRMQYLINTLARYDVHVAKYYLRRGAYVAAVNRAKDVITSYPQSPETRDALRVLVRAYDAMGMQDLSKDAQRVLDMNRLPDDKGDAHLVPANADKSWWEFWETEDGQPWWRVWK